MTGIVTAIGAESPGDRQSRLLQSLRIAETRLRNAEHALVWAGAEYDEAESGFETAKHEYELWAWSRGESA